VLLYRLGQYHDAEEHLREAGTICEQLLARVDSLQNRAQAVQTMSMLAAVLTDEGNFGEADAVYALAIEHAEGMAQDGENTAYQRNLAELCNNRAISLNMHGDYAAADGYYSRAAEISGALAEQTGSAHDRAMAALSLINRGENAFKLPDYTRSRALFEEGLRTYESALDGLGEYDRAQYLAWLSYYRLIHERDPLRAFDAAYAAYELQPDNVLINLILAYACLYCGYEEDAETLFSAVAALGEGQVEMIRRDLEAQQAAGMESDSLPVIYALLNK
jgi:tetratricopeptide (TPR) repeat protein